MTTHYLDVYSIDDDDESDPDPILYTTANDIDTLQRALSDALGNVNLEFLFHDDIMQNDAYNVRNADDDVIAVAYIGHE